MTQSSKSRDAKAAETKRLADALRANLRRRKTAAKSNKTANEEAPTLPAAPADGNEG